MSNKRAKWERLAAQRRRQKNGTTDALTGRGTSGTNDWLPDQPIRKLRSKSSQSPYIRARSPKKPKPIVAPMHILRRLAQKYPIVFPRNGKSAYFINIRDWALQKTGKAWNEAHKLELRMKGHITSDLWLRDTKVLSKEFSRLKESFYQELNKIKDKKHSS